MRVIKIAQVPPPSVESTDTVLDAVRVMEQARGGACMVVKDGEMLGIVTERDVMRRVVGGRRDPENTRVVDVMTTGLESVGTETDSSDALELMVNKHVRHLPVVDMDGSLAGLLSMRNLLQHHVEELVDQLDSLEAYFAADGPGRRTGPG